MACDLTLGRTEPCKDSIGGLKNVYFVNFGDMGVITEDANGQITNVAGSPSAYKYEVKDASSYSENIQSSRENGTTVFEQVLELTLKKLTVVDHKELKLLSFGRPHVIVEDNNGNFFLAGRKFGMEVTGGGIQSGNAKTDLSGYTLTLTGMEPVPANFMDAAPGSNGFTVVTG